MFSKLIKKHKKINFNKPKKVCYCYNISNYDIINAVNNGCSGINDIRKTTKAGTACGKCNSNVEFETYKALKNKPQL